MSKYTSGPWYWSGKPGQSDLLSGHNKIMGHAPHEGLYFGTGNPDRDEANARRIVACVNALSHMDTKALEQLASSGDKLVATSRYVGEARRERDKLLAALERFTAIMDGCCNWPDTSSAQVALGDFADEARSLVASVKAGDV